MVKKRYKKKKEAFDEFTKELRTPQDEKEDELKSDEESDNGLDLDELMRAASNTAPYRTPVPLKVPRKQKSISFNTNPRKQQATTSQTARTVTPDRQSTAAFKFVKDMDLNSFATSAAVHQTSKNNIFEW